MADDRDERSGLGLALQDSLRRQEPRQAEAMVPLAYAEKTMTSILRLHEDLVEEKERRIDLYRRLMDREQQLAELRAYVRLLEGEMARAGEKGTDSQGEKTAPREQTPAPAAHTPASQPAAPLPRDATSAGEGRQESVEAQPHGSTRDGPMVAWLPANLRRLGK